MAHPNFSNTIVVGTSGAIGCALMEAIAQEDSCQHLLALSRTPTQSSSDKVRNTLVDFDNMASIEKAAECAANFGPYSCIIVATGLLHDETLKPEKNIKQCQADQLARLYHVNAIGPLMIARAFSPLLTKAGPVCFAALSARVGSISDNHLGGWYGYRASKAALNMLLKCLAIEFERVNKESIVLGLHPGTVASNLSLPFSSNTPKEQLFSPQVSAHKLIQVLKSASEENTGQVLAWNGQVVEP